MLEYITFENGKAHPLKKLSGKHTAYPGKPAVIQIHPDIEFQRLSGIGGAFNENGGQALLSLPKTEQDELLNNLFAGKNSGLSFNRTPVGASDFALDAYSYSMESEDYDMKHFSIERDRKYLLPYIKKALAVNPEIILQASPWSPPAWMKNNGLMDQNSKCKPEDATLRKDPKIYNAYAKYLVRYIEAYSREGVDIEKLFIQNEPDTYQTFPGCNMTIPEMHDFTENHLHPAFQTAKLKTELWAGTIRAISGRFDHLELLDQDLINAFSGIGVQYFANPYLKEIHNIKPSLRIIHTEGICYNGDNSPEQARSRLAEIASYINSGCENYCYWNMILNENSRSAWGWKQNSLVTVDRSSGKVVYNPDYNIIYLVGQTLKAGDVRIAHGANRGIMDSVITVKEPNGKIKVLVQNSNEKPRTCLIRIKDNEKLVDLPADSACSIIL